MEVDQQEATRRAREAAKREAALMWPPDKWAERKRAENELYIKLYREYMTPINQTSRGRVSNDRDAAKHHQVSP